MPEQPSRQGAPWLPVGAITDEGLHGRISEMARGLPARLAEIHDALVAVHCYAEFDAACAHASHEVLTRLDRFEALEDRRQLLDFVDAFAPDEQAARVLRRFARDASVSLRRRCRRILQRRELSGVALPATRDGVWGYDGWFRGVQPGQLDRHGTGVETQQALGVPVLDSVGALRELLHIGSTRQLGYLLTACAEREDGKPGPYRRFTIAKRDGSPREICAPRRQLRQVQRLILDQILARVPPHDAAHGFVQGRSILSNAALHQKRLVVIKFDLQDFFPTLHFYRIMGLFARLGYHVEDGRFRADDEAAAVAPVLARLCTFADEMDAYGRGRLPQGAPTSPALSNLACRSLDARLRGLAQRFGGAYSRYADDLTFSFDREPGLGRFRWWVDQICQQEGFLLRSSKFHVLRKNQRQQVTGIVVNDGPRVPRDERRRLRAILHNCERHGVASQARGDEGFVDKLQGLASYVHMVHPEEGQRLLARVRALRGPKEQNP